MKPIARTLRTFLSALRHNVPIVCTRDGKWNYQSPLNRFWHNLVGDTQSRTLAAAYAFSHVLEELENSPVTFEVKERQSLLLYIKVTKTILMQMEAAHLDQSNVFLELNHRFVGLLYRLEDANGGFSRQSPDAQDQIDLKALAVEWKNNNPLIPNKSLSDSELDAIREACTYPLFVEVLIKSKELQDQFFGWIIRDRNVASPFVQFPAMQKNITQSSMAGRIGRVNPKSLKIQRIPYNEGYRKVLTLPFEGKDTDILNKAEEHTFQGDFKLTVAEVFRIFAEKYAGEGKLEFLGDGVCNWNYLKCARWNEKANRYDAINIQRKDWWKELPVLERLSLEQAQVRYGTHLDGKLWNIATAASRGSATLDYEQTHAYLNIAIPNGDGSYNIYDFGKLANVFPTTFLEKISVFAFNVHASVAYPDESIFYSQRQHTYFSVPMDESKAFNVMESIRLDMVTSSENHLVYQIESDNCARWAQHKVEAAIGEDILPNLFQMHLLATEPTGFTRWIFALIKKAPLSLRTTILTRLHIPLGASFGTWIIEQGRRVRKSLSGHEFFETGLVYLPAYLHRQQEMGLLGYVIECLDQVVSVVSSSSESLFGLVTHNNAKGVPTEEFTGFTRLQGVLLARFPFLFWRSDSVHIQTG